MGGELGDSYVGDVGFEKGPINILLVEAAVDDAALLILEPLCPVDSRAGAATICAVHGHGLASSASSARDSEGTGAEIDHDGATTSGGRGSMFGRGGGDGSPVGEDEVEAGRSGSRPSEAKRWVMEEVVTEVGGRRLRSLRSLR